MQDIEEEEIVKMAKLFDFKDFEIKWCQNSKFEIQNSDDLIILKPQPNEIFYIREDIPLELQEIILKANQEANWCITPLDEEGQPRMNEENCGVGYNKIIFIQRFYI